MSLKFNHWLDLVFSLASELEIQSFGILICSPLDVIIIINLGMCLARTQPACFLAHFGHNLQHEKMTLVSSVHLGHVTGSQLPMPPLWYAHAKSWFMLLRNLLSQYLHSVSLKANRRHNFRATRFRVNGCLHQQPWDYALYSTVGHGTATHASRTHLGKCCPSSQPSEQVGQPLQHGCRLLQPQLSQLPWLVGIRLGWYLHLAICSKCSLPKLYRLQHCPQICTKLLVKF